ATYNNVSTAKRQITQQHWSGYGEQRLHGSKVIPALLWLVSNGWELCQKGLWAKLKRPGGFIIYQVSVVLSTTMYATYLIYLMGSNYNGYLDSYSTNATCYCLYHRDPEIGQTETVYQSCPTSVSRGLPYCSTSLYCFLEGLDLYSLLTDLMDDGRQLAANRSMANAIMTVIGFGSYIVHVIQPMAFVRCLPVQNGSRRPAHSSSAATAGTARTSCHKTLSRKLLTFVSSTRNTVIAAKMVSVVLNLMLLTLRLFLFRMLGGFEAGMVPNSFVLFMIKEFYVFWQRGSEFCVDWWDLQREQHCDDD
ncbi:hypothetical protein LSH36_156g07000, partial [Paralvinella palmiformis]